jgi:nucleoside-diphosphate-sugar epimerase
MRVFVTGASGGIGSVVVPELITAGHEVLGLARSEASAQAIAAAGASVLRGDLDDPASLRMGVDASDGVIHLAFDHDFKDFAESVAVEARVVETFGAALEGSGKALVFTSGTPAVAGRAATEVDAMPTEGPVGGRGGNAQAVLDLATKDVRSAVIRLPRSVHEQGGPFGFAGLLIEAAKRTGISGYVGDGEQRWPAVHRRDAALLYRLVLEQADPGTVAHAVADEGDPMRSLAESIGRELGLATQPVPPESFGFFGSVFGFDQPASSAVTREKFGWMPTHPSLLDDLAAGNYP